MVSVVPFKNPVRCRRVLQVDVHMKTLSEKARGFPKMLRPMAPAACPSCLAEQFGHCGACR